MHKDNEWCEAVFNRKLTERIPTLEIFIGVQSQDAPCLFNLQEDDDEFISQSIVVRIVGSIQNCILLSSTIILSDSALNKMNAF